jgi:hypothetical protein
MSQQVSVGSSFLCAKEYLETGPNPPDPHADESVKESIWIPRYLATVFMV